MKKTLVIIFGSISFFVLFFSCEKNFIDPEEEYEYFASDTITDIQIVEGMEFGNGFYVVNSAEELRTIAKECNYKGKLPNLDFKHRTLGQQYSCEKCFQSNICSRSIIFNKQTGKYLYNSEQKVIWSIRDLRFAKIENNQIQCNPDYASDYKKLYDWVTIPKIDQILILNFFRQTL
jgi:hypothetical protein